MNKSLWQIRDSILQELRGGPGVDDDVLDPQFIEDKIHDYRKKLVEDYWIAHKQLDDSFYQKVCCLEVKCEETICDGIPSGVKETYVELPELLLIEGKSFIKYLGTIDWKHNFTELSFSAPEPAKGNVIKSSNSYYKRIGSRAMIYDPPTSGFKFMCMAAIPDNPMQLKCRKLAITEPYPIPGPLVSKLEYDIIQRLLKPMMLMQPDMKNNAKDDLRTPADRTT